MTAEHRTSAIAGKTFDRPICEFGECVYYKIPKRMIGPDLNKWDGRWAIGVFAGVRAISNEIYVGTSQGVIKCRAIRRRIPDDRWDAGLLNKFTGTPWDMKSPKQNELTAEEQLKPLPDDQRINPAESAGENPEKRGFKIYRNL